MVHAAGIEYESQSHVSGDDYDSLNPLVWDEPGFSISFAQYFTTIVGVLFLLVFLTREKDEDEPDA